MVRRIKMELCVIEKNNLDGFKGVLLPDVFEKMDIGNEIIALGVYENIDGKPTALGAIAGSVQDNRYDILSLYVAKEKRNHGYGKALVNAICEQADAMNLPVSISFISTTPEHQELENFLIHDGFLETEGNYQVIRVPVDSIPENSEEDIKTFSIPSEEDGYLYLQLMDDDMSDAMMKQLENISELVSRAYIR